MSGIEAFEQHAEQYDAWFELNSAAYEAELRAIEEALPTGGVGLEIGVGTGRFASRLGIRFGVEPSRARASIARSRGIEVEIGRAEDLPFPSAHFDFALMVTTVCFIEDLSAAFREAARVLKPGNPLIVGFIDRNSAIGRHHATRKREDVFYRHARFYSPEEVSSLLEESGFQDMIAFQTLFDTPEAMPSLQQVRPGYGQGAFVVLKAATGTAKETAYQSSRTESAE